MSQTLNILQIDVEDWYSDLDYKNWEHYESRINISINKVLSILQERNTQATFFLLGYIGEHFPEIVEKIKDENHEIGSHGYGHVPLTHQTPFEFEKDLVKSIKILEKIISEKILGYRAPLFTIVEKTSWAIDILKKNNLKYDSSVFPVKTHLYGVEGIPSLPYQISSQNIKKNFPEENFLEFPLSSYQVPIIHKNIPISGGFFLRFLPYWFIRHAIKKNNRANQPVTCYIHPWELDPKQPRINQLKWFHYYRLHSTEKKFKKLVKDFNFTSIKNWMTHA